MLVRAVLFTLASIAAAELARALLPGRAVVSYWLPVGLLFSILVANSIRHWPAYLLAGLAAHLFSDLVLHAIPFRLAAIAWAGDAIGSALGAALVRHFFGPHPGLSSPREVVAILLGATTVAGALSMAGAVVDPESGGWSGCPVLWAGRVAAMVSFVGLFLYWPEVRAAHRDVAATTLFLIVPMGLLLFGGFIGVLVIVPALIWTTLQFGKPGAAVAVLIAGVSLTANSAEGRGLITETSGDARLGLVACMFIVIGASVWLLAAVVGQQQAAAAAVRVSEQRYRSLVELSPDPIAVVQDGRFAYVNPALCQAFGVETSVELIGRPLIDLLHPDDAIASSSRLKSVVETGETAPIRPFRLRNRVGDWVTVESRAAVTEFAGRPAVQIVARDVSERLRAEADLQTSEERYRSLVEMSPDAILIVQDGRVVYANRMAMELAGVPIGVESLGRPLMDFIRPEDRAIFAARIETVLTQGVVVPPRHYRANRPDGRRLDVETRGGPCQHNGKPAVQIVVRDITERMRADESLREAEERLRTIIETEPECVKVVAPDGTVREMNAAGVAMLGATSAAEVIGRSVFNVIVPEFLDVFRAFHDRVCGGTGGRLQFEIVDLIGRRHWLESTAVPLRGTDGTVQCLAVTRDVTDRKRDEAALRESELRLRQLAEASDQVFWLTAVAPEDVLYVSPAFEAIWGYSPEELYRDARIWTRSLHPADAPAVHEMFDAWLRGERPDYDCQYRIVRHDGQVRWIHDHGTRIHDVSGAVYRLSGIARDISVAVEARLRRDRYAQALVSLWTARLHAPGQLSPSLEQITRTSAEALEVERVGIWLYSPDHARIVCESLFEVSNGRHSSGIVLSAADYPVYFQVLAENRLIAADDARRDPRTSEFTASYLIPLGITSMLDAPIRTEDGLVGIVCHEHVGAARAWSEEDQAFAASLADLIGMTVESDKRFRAEQALRESESFLRLSQRTGRVGSWDWNLATNGVIWSDETCRLHGIEPAAFDGRFETVAAFFHPDDREPVRQRIERILATGRFDSFEYRIVRPDGGVRTLWATGEVSLGPTGAPTRCYGTVMDVSERIQAEQALRDERASLARRVEERTEELSRANAELARANRLKDEFLANMSHELRTPLTSILGLTEVLLDGLHGPLAAKQTASLRVVDESGRHLLALINDVLDLAKIGAGKLEVLIGPVRVESVCRAALQMVRGPAAAKRQTVEFRPDPQAVMLRADDRRLKQVLVNLLSNAVKFTPSGGQIGLDVAVDTDAQVIRFTVWDSGIGIAPDELPRLFQPFVQAEGSLARRHEGTGLGLVLVERMVRLHGGGVAVESEPGGGSRFTVTLPWSADIEPLPSTPVPRPAPKSTRPTPLVLVVEDTDAIASLISTVLSRQGYEVAVAPDAKTALGRVDERWPDLLLTDIQLPGMDGLELIRRVRDRVDRPRVPVVAMTGQAGAADRAECFAAGADDYLEKPFRLPDLVQVVETHCPTASSASTNGQGSTGPIVLIAEDNEAAISLLSDALSAQGFRVSSVRSGAEALAAIDANRPDLIVSDIQMPGMDGLELIRRLRARPDLTGVGILAVTALAMPGDRERCLAAGADEYVSKPYRVATLVELVRKLADRATNAS